MRTYDNQFFSRGQIINNDLKAVILESKKLSSETGYIVLAVIPKEPQGEYITWFMDLSGNLFNGYYFLDLDEALQSLRDRN